MKFFIINSFRTMVYVAYIAAIVTGIVFGIVNGFGLDPSEPSYVEILFGIGGSAGRLLTLVIFTAAGWIAASLVCGLIVTLLDIRDDINDRLPDARRDD